jgi:23S rRNA (cytidine2498-2'-O)-methyltransferase
MLHDSAFQAHICFDDFAEELKFEIQAAGGKILDQRERLFLSSPLEKKPTWSQCTWQSPYWITVESINDAAAKLKAKNTLWMNYSFQLHRRSELIQQKLLPRAPKPLQFLGPVPQKNFGAWTLWDEKLVLASAQTSSVLPMGVATFQENKAIPSRAYLKLWELFTLYEAPPAAGSRVLDLGSSPGGWSWVLCDLQCDVISVDKAALDEKLLKRTNIKVIKKDAFTLQPPDVGAVDTVFSDIICEPKRLFELANVWLESGLCRRFVGSIKFKGKTDFKIIEQFCQTPKSRIYHLCANKHELTWVCEAI